MRKCQYEIRTLYFGNPTIEVMTLELSAYDAIEMANTYWRTDIAKREVKWIGNV